MKNAICFLLLFLFIVSPVEAERKKVAVVLGGGGAKGVSHIGVLKVLEEAGIPIDYVVGTSMGAIVGGLYAIGYTPAEIDSMVSQQDWTMLLSDRIKRSSQTFPEKENSERYILSLPVGKNKKDRLKGGVIKGQNLQNLFANLTIGYHDSVDFNSFHKPFAAVAVDVVSGQDYVFRQGSLPVSMRASMAIPAVFTPVRLDSMVLIDGGLNNNYPVDIAKEMGADIIIGVDLGTSDLKVLEGLNSPGDVLGQIVALHGYEKYMRNREATDLLIRPNMHPYHAASFSPAALDTLTKRGEVATRQLWDELIDLKQKIGVSATEGSLSVSDIKRTGKDSIFIANIFFEGIDSRDEPWLKRLIRIKDNSYITTEELQKVMSIVNGTNFYSNVSYKLTSQNDLVLALEEKSTSALNLGLRFDSEEVVGILLNGTFNYRARYRSKVAVTGRIGKTTYARLDYGIERSPLRNFNLAYKYTYNDLNIYEKGKKVFNTSYNHHLAEFSYSDMNWLNFKLQLGLRYEYFNYNSFLYGGEKELYKVKPDGFISYFAVAHLETLDRRYFPNKGVSLKADYSFYTDNFVGYDGAAPFSAIGVNFMSVLPLHSRLSLIPSVYGRMLVGGNLAYPFLNTIGGEYTGRYMPQQLPFAGINHIEILNKTLGIVRLELRQRLWQNHYISLIGNCGLHHDDLLTFLQGDYIWGGSIGYAYNSIAGPVNLNFGLSDRTNNLQFYLNLGYSF